ncbi:lipopolysaccharide biosynthesis protein [Micromonospora coxensis]|uniref:Membrane protein involved in the export of O-antigen and teichoic acid n=1 Tax=Micromonospora coxensis TaxID=356852 RepID=A0A1C5JRJ2_9ACTN|nr:oligosaccharide flippase family protein [Micromonospora coxensis]SCG72859.1 Membrane protein involved in the export of O-antigen and teichoic acid [Micromonospora coxensis]
MTRGLTGGSRLTSGTGLVSPATAGTAVGRPTDAEVDVERVEPESKAAVWRLLGLAVSALTQGAVMVVLARRGSAEMVGQYALGLAVSAPVVLLAGLGLPTVLMTDVVQRFSFREYLRLRCAAMTVAVVVIGALAAGRGATAGMVIMLVGIAKALDGVGEIYFAHFQRRWRTRAICVAMVINNLCTLVLMTALLVWTGNIVITVVGSVAGSALGSGLFCWSVGRNIDADASRRTESASVGRSLGRAGALAVIALPVGLASALNSFNFNVSRYALEQTHGTDALGVFAALSYVLLAANTVFSAVAQAVLPKMTRLYAAGSLRPLASLTMRLVLGCAAVGGVVTGVAVLAGGNLLNVVYGPAFAPYDETLTVLTLGVAIGGAVFILNSALLATRRFGRQFVASVVLLFLSLVASMALVPARGITGAAWALVLILGAELLLKTVMLCRAIAVDGRPARLLVEAGGRRRKADVT